MAYETASGLASASALASTNRIVGSITQQTALDTAYETLSAARDLALRAQHVSEMIVGSVPTEASSDRESSPSKPDGAMPALRDECYATRRLIAQATAALDRLQREFGA